MERLLDDHDIAVLREWLSEAGHLALTWFNRVTPQRKADRSPVTEADLAIEQRLVGQLSARFATYGILGEESTERRLDAASVWALDPLDGTAAFIAGLPLWAISLGLLHHGEAHFGMIHVPLLGDTYWGGPAYGAWRGDVPIQVSRSTPWQPDDWMCVPSNMHQSFASTFPGKARALGATATALCYVARGSAVAALIDHVSLWDVAAGFAILAAAGGRIEHLDGQPFALQGPHSRQHLPDTLVVGGAGHLNALRGHITEHAP
jgi:myo-inositol-1(or 4)-monophosphatase